MNDTDEILMDLQFGGQYKVKEKSIEWFHPFCLFLNQETIYSRNLKDLKDIYYKR